MNSANIEKPIPGIYCDVRTCQYNHNSSQCTAGKISVSNPAAQNAGETACSTFKSR